MQLQHMSGHSLAGEQALVALPLALGSHRSRGWGFRTGEAGRHRGRGVRHRLLSDDTAIGARRASCVSGSDVGIRGTRTAALAVRARRPGVAAGTTAARTASGTPDTMDETKPKSRRLQRPKPGRKMSAGGGGSAADRGAASHRPITGRDRE